MRLTCPTPPHTSWIMFFMCVFTPTLSPPGTRIKVPSSLHPELTNILWSGRDPGKGFTFTPHLFTWHLNTPTYTNAAMFYYFQSGDKNSARLLVITSEI